MLSFILGAKVFNYYAPGYLELGGFLRSKDGVTPIYGEGFFHVSLSGVIWYTIVFDYRDPGGEYWELLRIGGVRVEDECERLRFEMQRLMDEERIVVNGVDVKARVLDAFIEVRGVRRRSTATFIVMIPFTPRLGVNVYENFYGGAVAEYDYTVYWVLECGEIVSIESPGLIDIRGSTAVIRVKKGVRIPGYESVSFNIPVDCFRRIQCLQSS
jgi:hypothetical protein